MIELIRLRLIERVVLVELTVEILDEGVNISSVFAQRATIETQSCFLKLSVSV